MKEKINFKLNGENISVTEEPLKRLLDFLREDISLTGTKEGCGQGECGACSVIINGKLIDSCITPLINVVGSEIITIEGIKDTKEYKLLSDAFLDAGAVQCGFCIPGMIMASYVLLKKQKEIDEAKIREALSGNLCRCTGYNTIVKAVLMAYERGEGIW